MFVLTVKPLGCKITRNIADVLAFAEYRQSMFWPYGRVIKNSTGYHGECFIENQPTVLYLGQTFAEVYRNLKLLKEQNMYVKLNKALI